MQFKIGDILCFDNNRYRIIYIDFENIVICQMDISTLNLVCIGLEHVLKGLEEGLYLVVNSEENPVVALERLSDREKEVFQTRKQFVLELNKAFGPMYLDLMGKAPKEKAVEIQKKFGYDRKTFWKVCRVYLQSGLKEVSLLRNYGSKHDSLAYSKKTGNPGLYGISSGCIVTPEVKQSFDVGLKYYTSGRAKTYSKAFDLINIEFFSTATIEAGVFSRELLPADKRPTYKQFWYYCKNHLTQSEIDAIKTSRMEQRNNKRLLLSEGRAQIEYPGEKVECDAVEFDNSLVSVLNPSQTIGRPIVYVMRDVLTHAVVAFSVALDNNSVLGLTNLFLNLGDDKAAFCQKYGMTLKDPRLWPSNFLPQELYADRGSDFKSDPFGKICKDLGITRHLVSGGSGSLKGTIESWFHQMHSMINPHTENLGLIEKRYDSNHHKEATLNIFQFTKLVLYCVLSYNQSHMMNYMPSKEELQDNIDATPSILWEYYCKKKGTPRPITDSATYLYNLLTPGEAKLTRNGIEFKRLFYLNASDGKLLARMYTQQNRRAKFSIKYDPRDNSRIFYIDDKGNLAVASLNESLGWQRSICGLTHADTEVYFKMTGKSNKVAVQRNDEIAAARFELIENEVQAAKRVAAKHPDTTNMKEARNAEKQLVSRANAITDRLDPPNALPDKPETILPDQKHEEGTALTPMSDRDFLQMVADFSYNDD